MKQYSVEVSKRDLEVAAIRKKGAKLIQAAIKKIDVETLKQIKELDAK